MDGEWLDQLIACANKADVGSRLCRTLFFKVKIRQKRTVALCVYDTIGAHPIDTKEAPAPRFAPTQCRVGFSQHGSFHNDPVLNRIKYYTYLVHCENQPGAQLQLSPHNQLKPNPSLLLQHHQHKENVFSHGYLCD
jgi:hypothetical protein